MGGGRSTSRNRPHKVRPDHRALRATFELELTQLRRLGVAWKKLGRRATIDVIARFAEEFIDPDRSEQFLSASSLGPVDHVKWLRPDRTQDAPKQGALGWLASGAAKLSCLRLDRRARLPAVELRIETIDEVWATSWPGVYVHFESGRALAVTLDYEVFLCDLRRGPGSPYR